MKSEEVRYLRGNKELIVHASAVYILIEKEAIPGGLLPKSIDKIRSEITNGLCFLALINENLVGYVAIIPYNEMKLTKISSYVVAVAERRQGIGTELAMRIYNLAKELYPEHKVITVVKLAVAGKFEKLSMVCISKEEVTEELLNTTSICLNIPNPDKVILIEP